MLLDLLTDRSLVPGRAGLVAVIALVLCAGQALAQQPPAADAPNPQMPPMPSMEGQQGDVSKPVTQIPPRKKAAPPSRKAASPGRKAPRTGRKAAHARGAARGRKR